MAVLAAVSLLAVACGSGRVEVRTAEPAQPVGPALDALDDALVDSLRTSTVGDVADCGGRQVSSERLAALPLPDENTLRALLPAMKELWTDTVVLVDEMGVHPDHMIIGDQPALLLQVDDSEVRGRCSEILAAVAHPEHVLFVQWSEEDYSRVLDGGSPPWRRLISLDIGHTPGEREEDPAWISIGSGRYDVTSLDLQSDEELLAAELADRYGELIEISIGGFPYPPDPNAPVAPRTCDPLQEAATPDHPTIVAVTLRGPLRSGELEVVLRNDGPDTVHVVPRRVAELALPGSLERVTSFRGAMTAEERSSTPIAPGAEIVITAITNTNPCDVTGGYALPSGEYDIVLPIHVFEAEASESDVSDTILIARLATEIE